MSIINRPPEMARREYELQEPIAVAVDKDATFIQSTPDHVVDSPLKIVIGEMWSSTARTGPRKRAELSLAVGEVHQSASKCPQKHRAGWSFRSETFHGHRDRGRCTSEKSKPELCQIGIT
jgi:hypothetical protein